MASSTLSPKVSCRLSAGEQNRSAAARASFFPSHWRREPSEPSQRQAWKSLTQLVVGRGDVGVEDVSALEQHQLVVALSRSRAR